MSAIEESPRSYRNLSSAQLLEHALKHAEGGLCQSGAFFTTTGERTGRSPNDRYIVDEPSTSEAIDWGVVNRPFPDDAFQALWQRVESHLDDCDTYVSTLHVGQHSNHYLPLSITTETAWHSLFARNMFIDTGSYNPADKPEWKVLHAANFVCEPERDGTHSDGAVIIHFAQRKVLLAGMRYAGELKKALFSVQNFLLPEKGILPMHCAANVDEKGETCLFFGLSGTGKTTLSADPNCFLIGDDEHGWGRDTVFNLEGGCYAKTIDLCRDSEPVIWDAIRFGSLIENVVVDPEHREPDYSNTHFSENGRCSYPLTHIDKRVPDNAGSEPSHVIFLTCDVSGVLPPLARLTREGAAYHFLSGYTAKIGSTEMGAASGITPAFSACFGAPFMPRAAQEYADLLMQRLDESGAQVFLVNTGWTGGQGGNHGTGQRFPIAITRHIVRAIQTGELDNAATEHLAGLNLDIPRHVSGVDNRYLHPRNTWADTTEYDRCANTLAQQFERNISQLHVSDAIAAAGPQASAP